MNNHAMCGMESIILYSFWMILDIIGVEIYIPFSRAYFCRFFNRLVPIRPYAN